VNKGIEAILSYCRQQLEQGQDYLYEAKLLIVGEGGAGKTSLAKKIEISNYVLNHEEASTEGIDVIRWDFPLEGKPPFRLNIWDFGGQEIYHATHQFFLTKRSLYVLVVDTRQDNTDLYYWLSIVNLLSNSSPILIINNEMQDRICQINERELRGEFLNLKEVIATNLATNRGLERLVQTIQRYANQLDHIGAPLPRKWVDVRRTLETAPRDYISLNEYFEICERNGFQQRDDQLQLSDYLHDLGVCLHFQNDPLLKRVIILKPEWGTAAVYRVLDTKAVVNNQGRFSRAQLDQIWSESQYTDMRDELLQLMVNFKLCYEIPNVPGTYIAPNLLPVEQPDYGWDDSQNLILRYAYEFMPKGMVTRFIVEMHRYIEQQRLVWKSGLVLLKDEARAEVIERYNQRQIHIRVSGKRKKELLTIINHEFEKIHTSYERLQYQTLVPCNCGECKDTKEPQLYPLNVLKRFQSKGQEQIQCQKSFEMVHVRSLIDDVIGPPRLTTRQVRDKVFISYSNKDREWLEKLQPFLKPLERNGAIATWDDTQIQPGTPWREEIDAAIASAKVAVLLLSQNFLASDFIAENELPPFLDAAEREGLKIVVIPIGYCTYEESEVGKYQAMHPVDQPLSSLSEPEQEAALVGIARYIKAAASK
ncbi:MAG: COR domain-containing protein, partial [Elainellaceae cyanobacterium]